jgi:DNA-binding NarL/FixJ family response regulator
MCDSNPRVRLSGTPEFIHGVVEVSNKGIVGSTDVEQGKGRIVDLLKILEIGSRNPVAAMTNEKRIDIFFVEDNDVNRFAVKSILEKVPDFRVIGEASRGLSALEQLTSLEPTVVIVDIGLPDVNGIEITKRLKSRRPEVRVLMLTASNLENDIFGALDACADGYLLKPEEGTTAEHVRNLEAAVRSVKVGTVWLDPAIARLVLTYTQRQKDESHEKVDPIALSAEERGVLGLVAESKCENGMCHVNPDFVQKLHRFSKTAERPIADNPPVRSHQ